MLAPIFVPAPDCTTLKPTVEMIFFSIVAFGCGSRPVGFYHCQRNRQEMHQGIIGTHLRMLARLRCDSWAVQERRYDNPKSSLLEMCLIYLHRIPRRIVVPRDSCLWKKPLSFTLVWRWDSLSNLLSCRWCKAHRHFRLGHIETESALILYRRNVCSHPSQQVQQHTFRALQRSLP